MCWCLTFNQHLRLHGDRSHGSKSRPDWRSRGSNPQLLVYKASGLSTTPQRPLLNGLCLRSDALSEPLSEKTCLRGFATNKGTDQPESDQGLCYLLVGMYHI